MISVAGTILTALPPAWWNGLSGAGAVCRTPDLLIDIAIDLTRRDLNFHAHTAAGEKYLQRCGAAYSVMETALIQGSE